MIQIGLLDPQLNIVGGDHIASVSPEAGMTEDAVLSALELQLDAMGIPATFDLFSHELTLDNPMPEGYFLIWTTTDTGLNNGLFITTRPFARPNGLSHPTFGDDKMVEPTVDQSERKLCCLRYATHTCGRSAQVNGGIRHTTRLCREQTAKRAEGGRR